MVFVILCHSLIDPKHQKGDRLIHLLEDLSLLFFILVDAGVNAADSRADISLFPGKSFEIVCCCHI
jgi:hypothetical protein